MRKMFTVYEGLETFQIFFNYVEVSSNTFVFLGLPFGSIYMLVYVVHDAIIMTGVLINLNAHIKKDKLKDVFFIFLTKVF